MAQTQKSDFVFRRKQKSQFKSAGASVQSTTCSRGLRISGSNAGYTMFRGRVKSTKYPLHSPVFPFTSTSVRLRVPSHFNWSLPLCERSQPLWPLGAVIIWRMHRRRCYWELGWVITQPLCEVVLGSYPELGQGLSVLWTHTHTQRKCIVGKFVWVWWALGLFGPSLREAALAGR
jgi:hypothetical protein